MSQLRVAVIGAGHWGPNLISSLHGHARSRVVRVADASPERLAAVRARFPEVRCGEDAHEAIEDPEVDAVVVATPTRTHYALSRRALECGRHVLVEKPLCEKSADALELCELAEARGRVLMVGHVFLFNAAARRAKQYLAAGELGRIFYLSMERTNLGPIRVDVNAAWDLAAHDVSLASYWLDAKPLSVSARGGAWINPGIEDAVFATFRYPGDVLVHIHASWLHPRKGREIAIVGDKKMLTFDDTRVEDPIHLLDKRVAAERSQPAFVDSIETFRMSVREGEIVVPAIEASPPLQAECDHFVESVLSGQTPLSSGRDGLAVVQALEALSRSLAEDGREIAVDYRGSEAP
jgi:predicted dehydrogenase